MQAKHFENYRSFDIERQSIVIPLDVMITGVTGAGKSTTLNTLFEKEVAKVGTGSNPETMELGCYQLSDWLRLWDTPGLGDSPEKDKNHKKRMIQLLDKTWKSDFEIFGFIDLAIVIIEGSKRDLGTTIKLLEDVILPHIESDRVLVAINQADVAMKGRNWDEAKNQPNDVLLNYLEEFAISLRKRIYKDTKLRIPKPIYYSAERGYNIEAFLDLIIDHIPTQKRVSHVFQTVKEIIKSWM